jgi:hypothetical protein
LAVFPASSSFISFSHHEEESEKRGEGPLICVCICVFEMVASVLGGGGKSVLEIRRYACMRGGLAFFFYL